MFPVIALVALACVSFASLAGATEEATISGSVNGFSERVQQANPILHTSWEPRVVDTQAPSSVRLTVAVQGTPTRLEIVFADGSVLPLSSSGLDTYATSLSPNRLLAGYKSGDAHNFVGFLDVYVGAARVFRGNLFVNVRDQTMPDVRVSSKAADVQSSPHIVNIRSDAVAPTASVPVDVIRRFYQYFGDDFDFLALLHPVSYFQNRSYDAVKNDTHGLGLSVFDQSRTYGSAGRLQGIINYPNDGLYDLAETGSIHEIGHRWINYLQLPALSQGGPHWPISDLAYGVMGFSIPPTGEGGRFPFSLAPQGGGDYLLHQTEPARAFNDLELYLMGLIPADAVGSHFVFNDQNQLSQLRDGGVLRGPVTPITIADVVAQDGSRSPSVVDAQKSFRIATIVLSAGRLLSASEIAFFDHMAARGEATSPLMFTAGLERGTTLPFRLATGGRASLTTGVGKPSVTLARTIGFWKNWASCASSKGNQRSVLDQTLVAADPAGIAIGRLTLHAGDCLKAVRLLDKSTIDTGKKMASDPAFNLAAQLLAAKLNVVAGAGTCPAAVAAINDAQTLLAAVHFNGISHDKLSRPQAANANTVATTLDKYNNNQLC
jgi:hypothetical protein